MKRLSRLLLTLAALACLWAPTAAWAETVKARVLRVEERKGEVRVDVAGQGRDYRVNDRSLYRVLREGRLVVITTELVAGKHTIVDAQRAEQEGRVVRIDERRGSVEIRDSDSRATETFYFQGDEGPRRLREGDEIRFDVEERGMRRVITRWTPIGGGGGWGGSGGSGGGWGGSGGSGGGWGGSGGSGGGNVTMQRDSGRVVDVDRRRTQLTIMVDRGGRQTFDVVDKRLMEGIRVNDTIRFEWEDRRGERGTIVSIR